MDKFRCKICKVFTVKDTVHTFYVQKQPDLSGFGTRFCVMRDRRRMNNIDFLSQKEAVIWLLNYIHAQTAKQLDLF